MPKLFQRLDVATPMTSENAPEHDPFPGVREPEAGTDFLPPDPSEQAVQPATEDLLTLLREIAFNTKGLAEPTDGIVWQPESRILPTTPGDISVLAAQRVRFVYMPDVPRNMRVYSGSSRGLLIGDLAAGQTLQVELPYYTNGVFVEFDTGATLDHLNVYLSSRKIDISVSGPSTAVWG